MKRYIILILMTLATAGCRYTFELDDADIKPMIAVQADVCADSATIINIYKTIPVTEISKADTILTAPFYTLKCNGKEVDATHTKIGEGGMQIQAPAFKSGDIVELVYGAEDMETTISKTGIPEKFPEYEILNKQLSDGAYSLTIKYKEKPAENRFYGVFAKWRGERVVYDDLDGDGIHAEELYTENISSFIKPAGNYNSINIDPGAYSPTVIYFSQGYVFIWNSEEIKDNSYEFKFRYQYEYEIMGGYEEKNIELQYTLYTFSEEMYRTLFAYYDYYSNPFAEYGLSSPSFTYSNVKNGLGRFCGYTKTETEWFAKAEEK